MSLGIKIDVPEVDEHPMQKQWNAIMEGAFEDEQVQKDLATGIYGAEIDLGWKNMSFTMPTYTDTVFDEETQLFIVENLPENKREEVFKAFYRIDESRQSASANTGLGLTIAKDIIQGHGGRIVLNASNLGGLKVEIILPIKT